MYPWVNMLVPVYVGVVTSMTYFINEHINERGMLFPLFLFQKHLIFIFKKLFFKSKRIKEKYI